MINYAFTRVSSNRKTGPVPTVMSSKNSCPDSCELKANGCYAGLGFIGIHWRKLDKAGLSFNELLTNIKSIPRRAIWRYAVVGDLPGANNIIDAKAVKKLTQANEGKNGFTYTHYPVADNMDALLYANRNGFTVNLSANNLDEAEEYSETSLPVVVTLPQDAPNVSYTSNGKKIVVCPAQQNEKTTCATCTLCAKSDRDHIIGFRAHGASKKKVENIFFKGHKLVSK